MFFSIFKSSFIVQLLYYNIIVDINKLTLEKEYMNIFALQGHRVKCTSIKSGGYEFDDEKAQQYLELNKEYTVDHTVVESWSTTVYLQEIENVYFNSCFFDDVTEQDVEDDKKHDDYNRFSV